MKKRYAIEGMSCGSCKATVEKYISGVDGVTMATVSLEKGELLVEMDRMIEVAAFAKALPEKFTISQENGFTEAKAEVGDSSKWKQLRPLFLIFIYITIAAIGMHYNDWQLKEAMLDFMGLFYIVFSFFKFLDLKGFQESFGMYDPLAKRLGFYGWLYPFLELGLGLMFLFRFQIDAALLATLLLLGLTTIGVSRALMSKKEIQCACLGTALKLPMTEATFIENAIMILMALFMLFN